MQRVTLDPTVQDKLNGTNVELELVDPAGKTLGFFVPAVDHARLKQLEAEHTHMLHLWGFSQYTEDELQASLQDNELYTTEEVIRHLETL